MRQYKAKRIDNGEWVTGWYALEPIIGHVILIYEGVIYDSIELLSEVEVDSSTICQSTGLFDKNGVEVFEGDVVKIHHRKKEFEAHVVYKDYQYCYKGDSDIWGDKFIYSLSNGFVSEVIGNIHDRKDVEK